MEIKSFGNAGKGTINDLQSRLGFELPNDYIEFLINHNGGIFHNAQFFVSELTERIPLHTLYGINVESDFNIENWNNEYKDELVPKSIIIGHDYGGAGFVVLITEGEKKGVYFWDHTFFFNQSDESHNTYYIASCFEEFINQLE
jgi:hypothetical protein